MREFLKLISSITALPIALNQSESYRSSSGFWVPGRVNEPELALEDLPLRQSGSPSSDGSLLGAAGKLQQQAYG